MRATEILREEHVVIQQVLGCLRALAEQACTNGSFDGQSAREMVGFFRHFADQCHHGKEEVCLFPLMEARGFERDRGPTGVMLAEHEQGRQYLRALEETIDAAAAGNRAAIKRFADLAKGYVQLLDEHIFKENERLFPMADHVLGQDDQRRLLEQFARVEHDDMGRGTHERYLELADRLAGQFKVPRSCATAPAGHCCCGHHA